MGVGVWMPGCGSGAENGTGADVPGTDGGGRGGLAVEEVVDGKVQVLGEVRQQSSHRERSRGFGKGGKAGKREGKHPRPQGTGPGTGKGWHW